MISQSFSEIAKSLFFHFKFSLFFFSLSLEFLSILQERLYPHNFLPLFGPSQNPQSSPFFYTPLNFILFHILGSVSLTTLKLNKAVSKLYTNYMALSTPKRIPSIRQAFSHNTQFNFMQWELLNKYLFDFIKSRNGDVVLSVNTGYLILKLWAPRRK